MIRNTVGYYLLFTLLGTIANVTLAICLNECRKKYFAKVSQTLMILPTFISWIAVTFIVKALLDGQNGMVNHILLSLGQDPIQWYTQPKYWPVILTHRQPVEGHRLRLGPLPVRPGGHGSGAV